MGLMINCKEATDLISKKEEKSYLLNKILNYYFIYFFVGFVIFFTNKTT